MALTQVDYPVAPAITVRQGTLLDAAEVLTGSNEFSWHDGASMWSSFRCLEFGSTPTFCGANTKDLDQQPAWQDGVRFGAYGGLTCRAVGLDMAEAKSEARAAFEAGESTAVEAGVMAYRFAANAAGSGLPGAWAAPSDISAAAAVAPPLALAMLEGHAGRNYAGAPTIHAPLVIASLLAEKDMIKFGAGGDLRSKMGSKIVAGAGYDYPNLGPTGAAAATGEKWMYATGEVSIIRSDLIEAEGFDQETNDVSLLIERGYIVTVDCYAAAIRVDMDA